MRPVGHINYNVVKVLRMRVPQRLLCDDAVIITVEVGGRVEPVCKLLLVLFNCAYRPCDRWGVLAQCCLHAIYDAACSMHVRISQVKRYFPRFPADVAAGYSEENSRPNLKSNEVDDSR